jgi:cytochrome c oxidase assembly protein subunit 15
MEQLKLIELFSHRATAQIKANIICWLALSAVMIAMLVLVGGITRLTDSGLSIVEWKPVTGIVPPFTEQTWKQEFGRYQKTPEYQLINKGMRLEDFKHIYYWEYSHRLLARMAGLVFIVPLIYFACRQMLSRRMLYVLTGIAVLGGLQGVIGWYMVKSGLILRPDVSHYRLALHLGMAMLLFGALYLATLHAWYDSHLPSLLLTFQQTIFAIILPCVIFLQIIYGAFVAGLDAGLVYNSFPLMDSKLIPRGLWSLRPLAKNLTENIITVQFIHRYLGILVFALCIGWRWQIRTHEAFDHPIQKSSRLLVWAVAMQVILGISTLLLRVPVALAACHQMGAVILFALSLWNLYLCQQTRVGTNHAV